MMNSCFLEKEKKEKRKKKKKEPTPNTPIQYLLIRPYPSLRVLFASPTMRVPGIVQSPFLHRVCRKNGVRENLAEALREGNKGGVTARVRWLHKPSEDGDGPGVTRWLHCTPLIHHTGQVGLWMIVLVRPEAEGSGVFARHSVV